MNIPEYIGRKVINAMPDFVIRVGDDVYDVEISGNGRKPIVVDIDEDEISAQIVRNMGTGERKLVVEANTKLPVRGISKIFNPTVGVVREYYGTEVDTVAKAILEGAPIARFLRLD